ncbi:MAG: rane protein [Microbacteriaceae bacterium]|nr:rane protein [Microbacteriaceae bacterium]
MPRTAPAPLIRHGRLHHAPAWATVLRIIGVAIAVIAVSAVSVGGIAVWDLARNIKPGVHLIGETQGPPPAIGDYEGGFNVLVAASDSGGGDIQAYGKRGEHLNDVTMLIHVSGNHQYATVISFPRDLQVQIASCPNGNGGNYPSQTNKINVALTYGGLPCIVKTVENLTGLDIPYAALTEFNGVANMSTAVGGVTVCVATAIHDEQIPFDLGAGEQTLVGESAVQFLRVRYGLGDGSDLGRVSNQQLFLSALVRKIKTPQVLGNPVTVYQLAQAVTSNMTLSDSLTNLNTLVSMAAAVKNIDFGNVVFVQYPNGSSAKGPVPLVGPAQTLIDAIKADQPIQLTGKTSGVGGTVLDTSAPVITGNGSTATPTPGSSAAAPDTAASSATAVALPSDVYGQTAAQTTCTKGQTAG